MLRREAHVQAAGGAVGAAAGEEGVPVAAGPRAEHLLGVAGPQALHPVGRGAGVTAAAWGRGGRVKGRKNKRNNFYSYAAKEINVDKQP